MLPEGRQGRLCGGRGCAIRSPCRAFHKDPEYQYQKANKHFKSIPSSNIDMKLGSTVLQLTGQMLLVLLSINENSVSRACLTAMLCPLKIQIEIFHFNGENKTIDCGVKLLAE